MAIGFGAFAEASGTGSPVSTASITVSGLNTFAVVYAQDVDNNSLANISATWNSVAMTQFGTQQATGGLTITAFYLANPGTGVASVTRTTSVSTCIVKAAYYTGVKQTGQPDSTNVAAVTSTTTFTQSVTTVADNCWITWGVRNNSANNTAGANTTLRSAASNNSYGDTNADQTPPGSKSMNVTWVGSGNAGGIQLALAPIPAGGARLLTLMGLGT